MQHNKDGELKLFNLFGLFSLIVFLTASSLYAQSFADFKKSQSQSFQSYKDERDNAFGKYLKQQWKAYEAHSAKPLYEEPKPEKMPSAMPKKTKAVGPKITIKIKKPKLKLKPKIISKVVEQKKDIYIEYFGAKIGFNIEKNIKQASFYPQNQKGITNFFSSIASSKYEELLCEIKKVSKRMQLNDWGTYLLVLRVSNSVFNNQDDSRLLSWFIFNKLGYAVKVALRDKHVVLLHYSKKIIYDTPSFTISNKKYYALSFYAKGKVGRLFSYDQDYPDATKDLDLALKILPLLPLSREEKNIGFNEFGKKYEVSFFYNQNIINFMSTYPQADYETYFNAPMEDETLKTISLGLKKYLDGKKVSEAMNFVLSFVQKSFVYQRDEEHFGKEKVMFAQETLYFDKSDCEDRAVLYAYLVKELFHVPVVGVEYKNHMATAIYVPMSGTSLKIGSRKYVVADPTYINATIGMSMPKYRDIKPQNYIIVGDK